MNRSLLVATLVLAGMIAGMVVAGCRTDSPPPLTATGAKQTPSTTALEVGAEAAQRMAPIGAISFYLDGFHVMKEAPSMQMEAHHFCNQVNEELAQCVIFDGNTAKANMIGIEYIISEGLFAELPVVEQASWHPHNYEILSGTLVAPGLPDAVEKEMLKRKMNSYGKTWHVWDTGHHGAEAGLPLPVGKPQLAWSFNADGEAAPALIADRDARMGIDSNQKRMARQDLAALAKPQKGVDDLAAAFPKRRPIEGVRDERAMGR